MSFTITAPSKTFLVGEYVALTGGPTLILNTTPRFELKISQQKIQSHFAVNGINLESPAGKFLQQNTNDFSSYQLQFLDPYQGAGGFGASSAQFAMVVAAQQLIKAVSLQKVDASQKSIPLESTSSLDHNIKDMPSESASLLARNKKSHPSQSDHSLTSITLKSEPLLTLYQQCAWSGHGLAPSGVDVIAQCIGGITFYHRSAQQLEQLKWPFKEIDFCLIRTGRKIATHEHLGELTSIHTQELSDIVTHTYQSLIDNNSAHFVSSINQYAETLQKQQLVASQTVDLLQTLATLPSIIASKGCGALGADVILIIFETGQGKALQNSLKQLGITAVVFGHQQISQGVQCTLPVNIQITL